MLGSFTYKEYNHLLQSILKSGYKFCGYHEVLDPPFCMLRHDVDILPSRAINVAKIENEAQINSTYFLMLRSSAYNLFSKENTKVIEEIVKMSHWIGLHFDCGVYPRDFTVQEFAEACRNEVKIIENWFGLTVKAISYHRPNALVLGGSKEISDPLPHVYMPKYFRRMKYLSDSCGCWRYGHPLESKEFEEKKSLNLNMHPMWWNEETKSPLLVLKQSALAKKEELREYMLNNIVGV